MIALFVICYFIVGIDLFLAYWRWASKHWDDDFNELASVMIVLFWPAVGLCLLVFMFFCSLLSCGRRIAKK